MFKSSLLIALAVLTVSGCQPTPSGSIPPQKPKEKQAYNPMLPPEKRSEEKQAERKPLITAEDWRDAVKIGMTADKVQNILGTPEAFCEGFDKDSQREWVYSKKMEGDFCVLIGFDNSARVVKTSIELLDYRMSFAWKATPGDRPEDPATYTPDPNGTVPGVGMESIPANGSRL